MNSQSLEQIQPSCWFSGVLLAPWTLCSWQVYQGHRRTCEKASSGTRHSLPEPMSPVSEGGDWGSRLSLFIISTLMASNVSFPPWPGGSPSPPSASTAVLFFRASLDPVDYQWPLLHCEAHLVAKANVEVFISEFLLGCGFQQLGLSCSFQDRVWPWANYSTSLSLHFPIQEPRCE